MTRAEPGIRHGFAEVNELVWHYAARGAPERPLLILAHGFPEYWGCWRRQMDLLGDRFHCVAPDLTGYNLSSRPADVARYRTRALVADLAAFAQTFTHRPFTLVAHDWGGALAWAFALRHPERLARLVIINAVHPACFQREVARNPAQAAASQYIHDLRADDAEARYAADDCALLWQKLRAVAEAGHLGPDDRAGYLAAWRQPGALTGMFNWYRAMRMSPPGGAAAAATYDEAALIVRVPTRVLWGLKDDALLPGCLEDLDRFVPGVQVTAFPEGSHWLIHEQPEAVAAAIAAFAGGGAPVPAD